MRTVLAAAAAAALVLSCLVQPSRAGCVISGDGSAIDMVTDNGETSEKNCAVKCQVDTVRGVAQLSCGGNTPPLARAHSLCNFDRGPGYYKKVLSSEDTCKPTPKDATAPVERNTAALPKAANPEKPSFTCRISADGQTAEAVIANPYAEETHCSVDCQISTTRAGATFSFSCSKTAAGGGGEVTLCSHVFDKGKLVKMVGGRASCVKPLAAAAPEEKKKDDDDDDMPDQDEILRRMQRGEPMQNWLKKK
jgi:hypothetical protein